MKLNESQQILKNILNESEVPYGFKDFNSDDLFYSETNTHAYELLKGLKEYFDEFSKAATADPEKFQGVNDTNSLNQIPGKLDEAIKLCDKMWEE